MAYKNLKPVVVTKKPKTAKTKIAKLRTRVVGKPSYSFIVRCVNRGGFKGKLHKGISKHV